MFANSRAFLEFKILLFPLDKNGILEDLEPVAIMALSNVASMIPFFVFILSSFSDLKVAVPLIRFIFLVFASCLIPRPNSLTIEFFHVL